MSAHNRRHAAQDIAIISLFDLAFLLIAFLIVGIGRHIELDMGLSLPCLQRLQPQDTVDLLITARQPETCCFDSRR